MTDLAAPFAQGLVLQASLIVALGAQNLFVLESGLKRRKHFQVAALCSACDAALIAFGVLGAGHVFLSHPVLTVAIGAVGVVFLFWYGVLKLREGLSPRLPDGAGATAENLQRPLLAALAFSLLNPHVYLDTVVLIGGFSTKFPSLDHRVAFGAGAAAFSTVWFFGLAGSAARMTAIFGTEMGRRGVALGSAAILTILGAVLDAAVWTWARALA